VKDEIAVLHRIVVEHPELAISVGELVKRYEALASQQKLRLD
jgi:hypothetical protein